MAKINAIQLCTEALSNPAVRACCISDNQHNNLSIGNEGSGRASRLLEFFKPILEAVSWECGNMDPRFAKMHERQAKLAACYAMATRIVGPQGGSDGGLASLQREAKMVSEATTAAVDLPAYTRQLLITITRAYARLFALQLVGVIPLNGPTGRMVFRDWQYDSTYIGSSPYINPGDRDDDLTKLNPAYGLAPEGVRANKRKVHLSNMDISTLEYRDAGEWTDAASEDYAANYEGSLQGDTMSHLEMEHSRMTDRNVIIAIANAVPSANKYTWNAQPTSNPNYATQSPSEKTVYDELLFRDGINTTLQKIGIARKGEPDGVPNWAICGPGFALRLNKLQGFRPSTVSLTEMSLQTGGLRDYGVMEPFGIRFIVDYMLPNTGSLTTDTCIFGRKPMGPAAPGVYLAPYVAMQPTRTLYDPETGKEVQAIRSRYGIVQPNTSNPASSTLGDIYGQLTVNASGGAGV